MAGPTPEQNRFMHQIGGKHPDDYAHLGADGAGSAELMPGSLDPRAIVDAKADARQWIETYLSNNGVAAVPGADASAAPAQLMFNGKPTPLERVVGTVIAASQMGRLKTGDLGHNQIDTKFVTAIIRHKLAAAANPGGEQGDPAPGKKKKDDDDDSVETSVEFTRQGAQTQIQVTIKLRAVDDDKPNDVTFLPDIEVTLHVGKDADSSTVEAQLNLVKMKSDIVQRLKIHGHVLVQSVEFKLGVSGEAAMTDVALARLRNSLEVKIKAELEFKISKRFSISLEGDGGKNGVEIIPKATIRF